MKYLIIGSGAAGYSAACAIRKNDGKAEITLATEEAFIPYARPLISYFLKSGFPQARADIKPEAFYKEQKITVLLSKKAKSIDAKKKKVLFEDGASLSYDKLLLAMGSVPFVPPMEGVASQENVFTFLNFDSAIKIRDYIKPDMKVAVIGGGLIGLKAAEGVFSTCKDVTVFELADRILPTILDKQAASIVEAHLRKNGIVCLTGDTVAKAQGADKVNSLTLKSGKELDCDVLIVAVGVRPNVELAKSASAEVGRGVIVGEDMQTSVKDIYAAGDLCESIDRTDGSKKILALWPNAIEQGAIAGNTMSGGSGAFKGSIAMNAIDFFGMRVTTAGLINPPDDAGCEQRVISDGTFYKKFVIKDDLLKGYIFVNTMERAGLYTDLIKSETPLSSLTGDVADGINMLSFDEQTRRTKIYGR